MKGAKKLSLFTTISFVRMNCSYIKTKLQNNFSKQKTKIFCKNEKKQSNEIIFDTTIKFLQKFRHKLRVCKIITTTAHFSD